MKRAVKSFEDRSRELISEWFYDGSTGDGGEADREFLLKVLREGARAMRERCANITDGAWMYLLSDEIRALNPEDM